MKRMPGERGGWQEEREAGRSTPACRFVLAGVGGCCTSRPPHPRSEEQREAGGLVMGPPLTWHPPKFQPLGGRNSSAQEPLLREWGASLNPRSLTPAKGRPTSWWASLRPAAISLLH